MDTAKINRILVRRERHLSVRVPVTSNLLFASSSRERRTPSGSCFPFYIAILGIICMARVIFPLIRHHRGDSDTNGSTMTRKRMEGDRRSNIKGSPRLENVSYGGENGYSAKEEIKCRHARNATLCWTDGLYGKDESTKTNATCAEAGEKTE
ncbi:Uncharacterized protein Fot_48626 [Forsythia ovata]|uniref:Uncharacterized protein n=1 Tax=Forsythia ovata TaxID=205694 RepID=A0ABD1Q9K9_9LAMI